MSNMSEFTFKLLFFMSAKGSKFSRKSFRRIMLEVNVKYTSDLGNSFFAALTRLSIARWASGIDVPNETTKIAVLLSSSLETTSSANEN